MSTRKKLFGYKKKKLNKKIWKKEKKNYLIPKISLDKYLLVIEKALQKIYQN